MTESHLKQIVGNPLLSVLGLHYSKYGEHVTNTKIDFVNPEGESRHLVLRSVRSVQLSAFLANLLDL
jgi:hypothetical protein